MLQAKPLQSSDRVLKPGPRRAQSQYTFPLPMRSSRVKCCLTTLLSAYNEIRRVRTGLVPRRVPVPALPN